MADRYQWDGRDWQCRRQYRGQIIARPLCFNT
jgi:hypothetical protein